MNSENYNDLYNEIKRLWFGSGKLARSHCSRIAKVAHEFEEMEVTPQQIRQRRQAYIDAWPGMECTPESLCKWWHRFAPKREAGAVETKQMSVDEIRQLALERQKNLELAKQWRQNPDILAKLPPQEKSA